MDDFTALRLALEDVIRADTASLVESGRATVRLGTDDGNCHEIEPRRAGASAVSVCIQSEHEVSLWPTVPGTDRAPTVDIWDRRVQVLLAYLRQYLAAIFAGRVEFTLIRGTSHGRFRLWLGDGTCQTHFYNVGLWFLVGRGSRWEKFRPDPY